MNGAETIEVLALYGPSGTGKSTSAVTLAYEQKIPAIVDDGLLIFNGKRAAGTSAKFEKNYIRAVKRATFFDEAHAEEVRRAIRFLAIDKILLIGTSKKMADRIADKLKLTPINHYLQIEEIRSSREIKMALFVRRTKGDHLMPIPRVQVEQSFFRKLIRNGINIFSSKKEFIGETTIVRPDFHKNRLHISDDVFKTIAAHACCSFAEVVSCDKVEIMFELVPSLRTRLTMVYEPEMNLFRTLERIQEKINDEFVQYLELEWFSINLQVTKLVKM